MVSKLQKMAGAIKIGWRTRCSISIAAAVLSTAFQIQAAEVAPEQAQTAVGNWLRLGSRRAGASFRSKDAASVRTVRGKTGRAVYHAVDIKGGGFVVTSGDTRLPPVIAFSDEGRFADDGTGAFHALLSKSLAPATEALERSDRQAASSSAGVRKAGDSGSAVAEWAELLAPSDGRQARTGGSRKDLLADVRVDKLLKTEWGQSGISIWNWNDAINDWEETYYPSFDYYMPKSGEDSYPCGCVATVGAQIMKYWRMPSGAVASFSNTCSVEGVPVVKDSIPGAFDWDAMYLKWDVDDPVPSEVAREAVGKLTYNVAVAVGMEWGKWYGSSSPIDLMDALKDKFGYASGTFVWHDQTAFDMPGSIDIPDFAERMYDFYSALYASLDAKMPVILSIDGDFGGHAVIADGYGYSGGKRYTHLNFGWYGGDDAWYFLPDETLLVSDDKETYSVFEGIGFNIHPDKVGDVLSGRVIDANKFAVAGATVGLYDSADNLIEETTSDARGIYSFRITASGDYTVKASHAASAETPSKSVSMASPSKSGSFSAGKSESWAGWSGNNWGVELKFPTVIPSTTPSGPDKFTVTFDGNGGSVSPASIEVVSGEKVGDALPVATRTGYE
ncbi:MAG: C10 family peptidase, partial [Kiritimatiellae bacterium]|nr:C10 family peptidase [Kiritimatiellia bacterium]